MRYLPLRNKRINIQYIAYLTLWLYFVLFGLYAGNINAEPVTPENSHAVRRQIRYSYTLQNKTNRLLKKAEFWTYGPVKQTSRQRCIYLTASQPCELIPDDLGNQILYFKFDNLPPYATKIITIKAELIFSDTTNPIPMEGLHAFLRAEKNIESEDPELSQLAKELKASKAIKTAENIFQWVAENIQYAGYSRDEQGALYALRNRRGDCTEFMYLFIALCRANSIPARGIGGYVCSENTILEPNDYHNWAEFYEDGVWRIADPQKKNFMRDQSHYIATRVIGKSTKNPMKEFHRFRFKGEGLEVKMKHTYQ